MSNSGFGFTAGFLIILIVWIYQRIHMPKMRSFLGYTSRRAIKNEETWAFAQRFYSTFGIEIFTILLIGSIAGGLLNIAWLQDPTIQILGLGISLILQNIATERELRRAFPDSASS
ncbi:SdpI family protein [Lactiplantibacillus modestisalitolerans]|uniref:SdpI family protein n=1 Tax=Lactiplantibacillus modestisalitolerans TaxID=1457219 RepID=A0ABV5WW25_9LACO|nr:SdpI family protein [Lactiplantibacillus modestisalitolerans]